MAARAVGPSPDAGTWPAAALTRAGDREGDYGTVDGAGSVGPLDTARLQAPGIGYQLVATWSNRPWQLTPGRYGRVADISATPDGTTLVLDGRHNVVHVLAPDGQPRGIIRLPGMAPGEGWEVQRLDAGFDGTFTVLCLGPYEMSSIRPQRLYRLTTDGQLRSTIELEVLPQTMYVDVAQSPDGRVYLVRTGPQNPFVIWPGPTPTPRPGDSPALSGVDVLDGRGRLLETIRPPEMDVPFGVDVDETGAVFVLNRVPVPWHEPPPEGTATPRPSLLGRRLSGGGPALVLQQATTTPPSAAPVEGVMFFAPDHSYLRTWPFAGAEDLAVGPGGLYVSRQVEIYRLPETEPLYTGPFGRVYAAMVNDVVFHLDVAADGRLRAGMSHCYFQGVLDFGLRPASRTTPLLRGRLDRPELEGPAYPLRLSFANGRLAVLQGRYTIDGLRPNQRYVAHPFAAEPQTIQLWTPDGRLEEQWGVCSSSESWWVRDLAATSDAIFTADSYLVHKRPDSGFPAWTYVPALTLPPSSPSRLAAVAADGNRLAVFDLAANRISLLDTSGSLQSEWPVAPDSGTAVVDIALHHDRLYLADGAGRRVLVLDQDGTQRGSWPVIDAPRALAVGPGGDVFVLGSGGWIQRYRPDGERLALWTVPQHGPDALDLAVGDDATVYVAFVGRDRTGFEARYPNDPVFHVTPAGIWLFRETALPEEPVVPRNGCLASPGKSASPTRLPLGDEVAVRLDVTGACPPQVEPVQLMLVFDTSRSMNWNNALERAKDAAMVLIRELAPGPVEVGLATFDDDAALRLPPTSDLASLRAAIGGLQAWGDTRLSGGIAVAQQALLAAKRPDVATQAIIILTDGVIKDDPSAAAASALEAGLELHAWLFPTYEYEFAHWDAIASLLGSEDRLWRDPDSGWLAAFAAQLRHQRPASGLFEAITIVDQVPANMRYVADSARPEASWDPVGRTLTWTLGTTTADELWLDYRLEPLDSGFWPTNVMATASYTDALGLPGKLVFPIPYVEVYAPRRDLYLPLLSRHTCVVRQQPLDVLLILDASSSMMSPAPGGGTKMQAAGRAAALFVSLLRQPIDRVAVIAFNDRATVLTPLTGDLAHAQEALGRIETRPGTAIDLGLQAASEVLESHGRPGAVSVAVLLSDGAQTLPGDPAAAAQRLRGLGVILYAVGFGEDVVPSQLIALAGATERYLYAPSADELEQVFRDLALRVECDGG